jgi:hypothetical protein
VGRLNDLVYCYRSEPVAGRLNDLEVFYYRSEPVVGRLNDLEALCLGSKTSK